MRLIDADALKLDIMCVYGSNPQYINWLNHAPTVDAEPVRHGKWIHEVRYTIDSLHSYQQYRCSECDMTYITNTNYCPHCGARMDEE